MRKGLDSLSLLVQETLLLDPFIGHLFIFYGKRSNRIEVLFCEQNEMCLFMKRLDQGMFTRPSTQPMVDGATSIMLSPAQMSMLIEGLERRTPVRPRQPMIAG